VVALTPSACVTEGLAMEIERREKMPGSQPPTDILPKNDFGRPAVSDCFIPQIVLIRTTFATATDMVGDTPRPKSATFSTRSLPSKARNWKSVPYQNMEWALLW